jgi:hypothetical protein
MRTHRAIQKNLYGYLRDEVSAEDRQAIGRHVNSCAACRKELQSMRETMDLLTQKVRRPSENRNELYWQRFTENVERRIQVELTEGEPQSFVGRLLDLLVENRKPFSVGFASALSAIVLALAIWSLWTKGPMPDQAASDSADAGASGLRANMQKTALEMRAENYLEQSKILLIGIMNTDTKSLVETQSFLKRQQAISRTLVRESQEISLGLTDPSQQRLRELVSDLELILLQIANLESRHGIQGVEIVKGGVERNGILFKINFEEIQRATQSARDKGSEKKAKSTI